MADEQAGEDPGIERGVVVPGPVAAVLRFAIGSVVAIFSFLVIYLGALGLAVVLRGLNGLFGAEPWLASVGEFVEHVLVYVDVALLLIFLCFEVMRFARGQWREFKEQ